MLSLPDFKEKQLLFIRGAEIKDKIKFTNENICFLKDGKIENQVSCHKVFILFIIGECSLTTALIKKCHKYGVSIFLLNDNLATYSRIISLAEGNYLLRMRQYNLANELNMAKNLVLNKIQNQIFLLEKTKENNKLSYLDGVKNKITSAKTEKELLGIEGSAGKFFFENYFSEIGWYKRMPRVKADIVNYLMDLGYTILFNFIDSMLGIYGFDAYKGFYHKLFFQRKSLACDLVEPFRSIIDKQILKSYHLNQVNEKDFKFIGGRYSASYENQRKYLKIFSENIMDHKEEIFCYVRNFYYFIMNNSEFPYFEIK